MIVAAMMIMPVQKRKYDTLMDLNKAKDEIKNKIKKN